MLQFVRQKLKNKKGLNFCLLAGMVLLIAVFSCHPTFAQGSCTRMLLRLFEEQAEATQQFPAVFSREESRGTADTAALLARMDAYADKWTEYVAVDTVETVEYLRLSGDHV